MKEKTKFSAQLLQERVERYILRQTQDEIWNITRLAKNAAWDGRLSSEGIIRRSADGNKIKEHFEKLGFQFSLKLGNQDSYTISWKIEKKP